MKKPKKGKVPKRETTLNRLAAKLRTALGRETKNTIEIGDILIESRKLFANEHGEWLRWLEEKFDLSIRTAQRYIAAAEYVARQMRHGVSHFSNLSPTVLYGLAAGHYTTEEEAAILAATRKRRVDQTHADAICNALKSPDSDDAEDADDQDDGGEDAGDVGAEDAESKSILDGPPPAVPPPAPITTPDFALRDFDQAVGVLKRLMTKSSAQFASTVHTIGDLEGVENFIRAVADRAAKIVKLRA